MTDSDRASLFAGKAAIITGASSGFGRLIAQTLAAHGMELWLTGRSSEGLKETAASIANVPVHCEPLDLRSPGALGRLVRMVGKEHPYLFALINNAGMMYPEPVIDGNEDHWRAMFEVNVVAPADGCKAAIAVMRAHKQPAHLINISSLAARMDAGGVYGASKLALEMVSRSIRQELEMDDIRVTTIIPGGFAGTELGRDIAPSSVQALMANAAAKGCALDGPNGKRVLGDASHIARTVQYVLEQPVDVNLQEIIVRPPAALSF